MKKFQYILLAVLLPTVALAATTAKKQSAIQNGTTVRAKSTAAGLYDAECYDAYYGCMDQFCISENANGGSCLCSNENEKYESELVEINEMLAEAERIKTIEVEKIQAGSNVDIIFGEGRAYDEYGNVTSLKKPKSNPKKAKQTARDDLMQMFTVDFDLDDDQQDDDSIMTKTGAALFNSADKTCTATVDAKCKKDLKLLRQMYLRQIDSDCRGFANSIAEQRAAAQMAMTEAERDVRNAYRESFDSANKYNLGECMVELKKCMQGENACGTDWVNCVSTVASERMRNKTVRGTGSYGITKSVEDALVAKRTICERVLDQCMEVRDEVWPYFLREAAPTLKLAESRAESNMRQSCLTDITNCLHTACRDDIADKGVASMDACLANPNMAKSFCTVRIEPCEDMDALVWDYVVDKLAAMRVDACTTEVKDCLTDAMRCGPDFSNCIGMDFDFIRGLCPVDKLVVCKAYHDSQNEKFTIDELDSIITGLYLNIDNKALENCQKLVEDKMAEICGSTTDCNKFASDDTIGTGSLHRDKDGNVYRITGMISFGYINVGNGDNDAGIVDVSNYITAIKSTANNPADIKNRNVIIKNIENELTNIASKINDVIEMIESDPQIQFCVSGRNLKQITGVDANTKVRFPNLLNQVKMQIALAGLRKAQDNYQAKYNEYLADATKNASADIAQYMCQMLPTTGGAPVDGSALKDEQTNLAPPYAISYEVGAGLNNKLLAQGGRSTSKSGGKITNGKKTIEFSGGTREMWATFNRNTRICRLCTSTITRNCDSVVTNGLWGIGGKTEVNCTESEPIEKCDDIEM